MGLRHRDSDPTDSVTLPTDLLIGGNGLLGRSVLRTIRSRGTSVARVSVPWTSPRDAVRVLEGACRAHAAHPGWRLYWCAGAGVVATGSGALDDEVSALEAALRGLETGAPGTVCFASSAGGLYAGAAGAPFTEEHEPAPIAPYGHAKLRAERLLSAFAERSGSRVLIARIGNLYGPGQDVGKAQGLISQLCLAMIERRPISVYVPLDTVRDYIYVDDCATMMLDAVAAIGETPGVSTKIVCSHRPTTIATIIGEARRLFNRRPLVAFGSTDWATFQARDLRLRSVVMPQIDRRSLTPLAVGMERTANGLLAARLSPR